MGAIDWKFSKKALKSIAQCDAFINIWEGAVRSSKTVSSIIAWINFIAESPHSEFLITGKTENTAYRNIIGGDAGIIGIMGDKRAKFLRSGDGGSQLILKFKKPRHLRKSAKDKWTEKVCYVIGCNDVKSEEKIRGMTTAGWYADEVTLYPESVVKQAINRMSLDGARAFWTCNPDSPYHYIKTEFIDEAKNKGYKVFHFTLDDNKALSDRYKDNLKKAYKGLWYKRMVLGLWVMADGIIYDMFNHDIEPAGGMVVARAPKIMQYWVGIDYGQSNATAFLLAGLGEDNRMYIIDEFYHSGKDSERQYTPSQYARRFAEWIDRRDENGMQIIPEAIYIDPSAKGFILEMYNSLDPQLRRKLQSAFNDVKLGIEVSSGMIGNDQLRVLARCKNFLRELASYCWCPNAQKNGLDKPMKNNDHAMDAFRYMVMGTRKLWNSKLVA